MQCFRPIYPIKALTFDLDDTLYNNDPIIRRADHALTQKINATYPALGTMTKADWLHIKLTLIQRTPALSSDMGKLRWQTLFTALGKAGLSEQARAQAATELFDFFYAIRSDFTVASEVLNTLGKLADKVPLIAITNGNVDIHKIGLAPYFTLTLHASIDRPRKPNPDIFKEAIASLALPPSQIMHVGDNQINDVLGAHKVGMQTAWYACNRNMNLNTERVAVLPSVMLRSLDDLHAFI